MTRTAPVGDLGAPLRDAADQVLPRPGLKANWRQFTLLVIVNAFVGAMVGLERTVLPLIADEEFGLASRTAALSFIAVFGAVKAITNLVAGASADRWGRKRILIAGWMAGVPVPLLIIWAPSWPWIVVANVLLGINQGLAWSAAVIMKIDLAGSKRRGLAMGLNEFAGYVAVALSALATGMIASRFGLRPEPFYLGIAIVAIGLGLSLFLVRDTTSHARGESLAQQLSASATRAPDLPSRLSLREIIVFTSWRNKALFSASQAGLVNNLNDGLAWGLFPLFFTAGGVSLRSVGWLAFLYPATWGVAQLWTGALSDRIGRKWLIVTGMVLQGVALLAIAATEEVTWWTAGSVLLGLGTAMVYPTLLATVGDVAHPDWRSSAVGVYRLWRDLGYVAGALLAGIVADALGMSTAIALVGWLTVVSGVVTAWRMPETLARK